MMKRLLVIGLAVLCVGLASAKADLFGFSYSNPLVSFDGVSVFTAQAGLDTTGDVYRNVPPIGTAVFDPPWGLGSLLISMNISSITGTTADGSGSVTLKDMQGDTINGNLAGQWVKVASSPVFSGTMSNVTFTKVVDNNFNGHIGSISMLFDAPQPWTGTLVELTTAGAWFQSGAFSAEGGSIDATVVPLPAAVLLGLLGLCAAGLKLRKFA